MLFIYLYIIKSRIYYFNIFHVVYELHYDTRPLWTRTSSGMCQNCRSSLFSIRNILRLSRYVDFVSPFWVDPFFPPEPLSPSDPPYSLFSLVIFLALVFRGSVFSWPLSCLHPPWHFPELVSSDRLSVGSASDRIRIRPNRNRLIVFYWVGLLPGRF